MKDPKLARYATGNAKALKRGLTDYAQLERGRLASCDVEQRYTPAGFSDTQYGAMRMDRDDMHFREWGDGTEFAGLNRWPPGPGMKFHGKHLGEPRTAEDRIRYKRWLEEDGF